MDTDEQLRHIVCHAAANVPFYRRRYGESGVDPLSIRGRDDLQKLPIISPLELVENNAEFRAENVTPYRITSTSGTSRSPKTLLKSARDTQISTEVQARLFLMAGLGPGDQLMIGQPFDLAHLGYLCLDACRLLGMLAIPVGLSVPNERLLQLLRIHRPEAIYTSPSRMTVITQMVAEQGQGDLRLCHILLAGERTSPAQRAQIVDFWGIEPHDLYGSEETDGLGGSCEHHCGLHFMDDRFFLELVDSGTSQPVSPGESGEMVITSLYAEASPLIRYRLGDIIEPIDRPCSCGRPWPLISVKGRASAVLFLYDGIKLHAYQAAAALREVVPELDRFQLVCRALGRGMEEVEVRLSIAEASITERHQAVEEAMWNSSLDLAAARDIGCLRFRVVSGPRLELVATPRGKAPEIVDLRQERVEQ